MAAVGLAVAWKEYLQNRELDKKLTQAGYEHSGLQKQVQDLGNRSAQLESEVKSLREASRRHHPSGPPGCVVRLTVTMQRFSTG